MLSLLGNAVSAGQSWHEGAERRLQHYIVVKADCGDIVKNGRYKKNVVDCVILEVTLFSVGRLILTPQSPSAWVLVGENSHPHDWNSPWWYRIWYRQSEGHAGGRSILWIETFRKVGKHFNLPTGIRESHILFWKKSRSPSQECINRRQGKKALCECCSQWVILPSGESHNNGSA